MTPPKAKPAPNNLTRLLCSSGRRKWATSMVTMPVKLRKMVNSPLERYCSDINENSRGSPIASTPTRIQSNQTCRPSFRGVRLALKKTIKQPEAIPIRIVSNRVGWISARTKRLKTMELPAASPNSRTATYLFTISYYGRGIVLHPVQRAQSGLEDHPHSQALPGQSPRYGD